MDVERQFYLVELILDSDPVYLSTTPFDVDWNGEKWLGAGAVAGISPPGDSIDMSAQSLTLELRGIPLQNITDARNEKYRNRVANIYYGRFDESYNLITPVVIFSGTMDSVLIRTGGGTAIITVEVLSPLIEWEKTRPIRYTTESQRTRFPNDLGFEFVSSVQNQKLQWGVAND